MKVIVEISNNVKAVNVTELSVMSNGKINLDIKGYSMTDLQKVEGGVVIEINNNATAITVTSASVNSQGGIDLNNTGYDVRALKKFEEV